MKNNPLPTVENKVMETEWGRCIGHRAEWDGGMYCSIITNRGLIGCGAYDVVCLGKAKHIVAISRGTDENPYIYPEQLLEAPIMDLTDDAYQVGIRKGMKGKEALKLLLELDQPKEGKNVLPKGKSKPHGKKKASTMRKPHRLKSKS